MSEHTEAVVFSGLGPSVPRELLIVKEARHE